ncbi:uncharacterized protein LOC111197090 [Astyanax mexicanus]|uniref:uncharacterized protein LOC111197090 n=1 Tax=Astyanax mexicanus TaxID=7994 RepID=UPI0020CB3FA4|nr:uncharacterized protein LOC111197090 [Astyanax mexicanus]
MRRGALLLVFSVIWQSSCLIADIKTLNIPGIAGEPSISTTYLTAPDVSTDHLFSGTDTAITPQTKDKTGSLKVIKISTESTITTVPKAHTQITLQRSEHMDTSTVSETQTDNSLITAARSASSATVLTSTSTNISIATDKYTSSNSRNESFVTSAGLQTHQENSSQNITLELPFTSETSRTSRTEFIPILQSNHTSSPNPYQGNANTSKNIKITASSSGDASFTISEDITENISALSAMSASDLSAKSSRPAPQNNLINQINLQSKPPAITNKINNPTPFTTARLQQVDKSAYQRMESDPSPVPTTLDTSLASPPTNSEASISQEGKNPYISTTDFNPVSILGLTAQPKLMSTKNGNSDSKGNSSNKSPVTLNSIIASYPPIINTNLPDIDLKPSIESVSYNTLFTDSKPTIQDFETTTEPETLAQSVLTTTLAASTSETDDPTIYTTTTTNSTDSSAGTGIYSTEVQVTATSISGDVKTFSTITLDSLSINQSEESQQFTGATSSEPNQTRSQTGETINTLETAQMTTHSSLSGVTSKGKSEPLTDSTSASSSNLSVDSITSSLTNSTANTKSVQGSPDKRSEHFQSNKPVNNITPSTANKPTIQDFKTTTEPETLAQSMLIPTFPPSTSKTDDPTISTSRGLIHSNSSIYRNSNDSSAGTGIYSTEVQVTATSMSEESGTPNVSTTESNSPAATDWFTTRSPFPPTEANISPLSSTVTPTDTLHSHPTITSDSDSTLTTVQTSSPTPTESLPTTMVSSSNPSNGVTLQTAASTTPKSAETTNPELHTISSKETSSLDHTTLPLSPTTIDSNAETTKLTSAEGSIHEKASTTIMEATSSEPNQTKSQTGVTINTLETTQMTTHSSPSGVTSNGKSEPLTDSTSASSSNLSVDSITSSPTNSNANTQSVQSSPSLNSSVTQTPYADSDSITSNTDQSLDSASMTFTTKTEPKPTPEPKSFSTITSDSLTMDQSEESSQFSGATSSEPNQTKSQTGMTINTLETTQMTTHSSLSVVTSKGKSEPLSDSTSASPSNLSVDSITSSLNNSTANAQSVQSSPALNPSVTQTPNADSDSVTSNTDQSLDSSSMTFTTKTSPKPTGSSRSEHFQSNKPVNNITPSTANKPTNQDFKTTTEPETLAQSMLIPTFPPSTSKTDDPTISTSRGLIHSNSSIYRNSNDSSAGTGIYSTEVQVTATSMSEESGTPSVSTTESNSPAASDWFTTRSPFPPTEANISPLSSTVTPTDTLHSHPTITSDSDSTLTTVQTSSPTPTESLPTTMVSSSNPSNGVTLQTAASTTPKSAETTNPELHTILSKETSSLDHTTLPLSPTTIDTNAETSKLTSAEGSIHEKASTTLMEATSSEPNQTKSQSSVAINTLETNQLTTHLSLSGVTSNGKSEPLTDSTLVSSFNLSVDSITSSPTISTANAQSVQSSSVLNPSVTHTLNAVSDNITLNTDQILDSSSMTFTTKTEPKPTGSSSSEHFQSNTGNFLTSQSIKSSQTTFMSTDSSKELPNIPTETSIESPVNNNTSSTANKHTIQDFETTTELITLDQSILITTFTPSTSETDDPTISTSTSLITSDSSIYRNSADSSAGTGIYSTEVQVTATSMSGDVRSFSTITSDSLSINQSEEFPQFTGATSSEPNQTKSQTGVTINTLETTQMTTHSSPSGVTSNGKSEPLTDTTSASSSNLSVDSITSSPTNK